MQQETQQTKRSRMVGAIEVTPLWDGPLPSSLDKVPDPRHRAEAEALISKAGAGALGMNVYGFLLRLDSRWALIDTGAGRLMYDTLGKLGAALDARGVTPAQIETIFLTHVHRDHYGGLVDANGAVVFPNAEIVLHDTEAKFWLDTPLSDMPQRARRYRDDTARTLGLYASRIRRVKDNEGLSGVTAQLAPGHTPGHTAWLIQSGGQSMLAWGDLIHLAAIHLPAPHIAMEYDLEPDVALKSRLRVLDWVARDKVLIAGAHLPAPGVGAIVRDGSAYRFEPDHSLAADSGELKR
jgi:glyoxylase-like metal-dependent hydrolase (beta-lactamase superfamily II)